MQFRPLGRTGLNVSLICLGTMTWGRQNTEAEAHAQLDYALERGINFIDAAEMYPVPPGAETHGRTEQFIGTWLKNRKDRDKIILATKVAARGRDFEWLRGGPRLDAKNINQALDASLKRLQTDYVDLYQLHWPDRRTNTFGQLGYKHDANDDGGTPIEETLEALQAVIKAGKVRHIGVSNETPWGVMKFLQRGRDQRPAAHRLDPERLQPAQPQLRDRQCRSDACASRSACWPIRRSAWRP